MTIELARGLPAVPARMAQLPISPKGFPVPWFVWFVWFDPATGVPDFRVIAPGKILTALNADRCWLCGGALGRHKVFAIGPMCAINRITSEPPSHRECAEFAAEACPFLSQPKMRRNEKLAKPDGAHEMPGRPAKRNPGGVLLWESRDWRPRRVGEGLLIDVGEPDRVDWYVEGRPASREEAEAIFDAGAEFLRNDAPAGLPAAELAAGLAMLEGEVAAARRFLPAEGSGSWWAR